jgi:hypothetical protein
MDANKEGMVIHCDANGLKLAIEDALSQMKGDDCDGFDYTIGEVDGMKLRIVAETDNRTCYNTVIIDGGLNYTAVVETS